MGVLAVNRRIEISLWILKIRIKYESHKFRFIKKYMLYRHKVLYWYKKIASWLKSIWRRIRWNCCKWKIKVIENKLKIRIIIKREKKIKWINGVKTWNKMV